MTTKTELMKQFETLLAQAAELDNNEDVEVMSSMIAQISYTNRIAVMNWFHPEHIRQFVSNGDNLTDEQVGDIIVECNSFYDYWTEQFQELLDENDVVQSIVNGEEEC